MSQNQSPPTNQPPRTDLLQEAMQHTGEREQVYHGTFTAEARAVKLVKGVGKVAFDDAADDQGDRRISVDATVMPLDPLRGPISRSMITSSAEWKLLRESLMRLGLDLSKANGRPVRIRFVQDEALGTYTDKAGLTKPRTALVVEAVFATPEDAQEDYQRHRREGPAVQTPAAATPVSAPAHAQGAPGISKAVAQAFLPGLWKSANGDVAAFAEVLKTSPAGAHFTLESPEVRALIGQAAAPAPAGG